MKKSLILTFITSCLLFMICFGVWFYKIRKYSVDSDYVIYYLPDNSSYFYKMDIVDDDNYIYIHKLKEIKNSSKQCIKFPCDYKIIDAYRVKYTIQHKEFINSVLGDNQIKEITIFDNILSYEEKEIISSITHR